MGQGAFTIQTHARALPPGVCVCGGERLKRFPPPSLAMVGEVGGG